MIPGIDSQATAADYSRALERGVAWLKFEPIVESEFRHSHVLRVRPQARFWQIFQLIVGGVAARVVLDVSEPGVARTFLLACNAVQLAVSIALVTTTFSRAYARSYLTLATVLTPFRAIAFAIIVAAVVDVGASGTAALTINMFGLLFFSGLLLRQALPSAILMCVAFAIALAAFDVAPTLAAYSSTSLLVVFGLAGFVAWDMQRVARQAFLEHGVTRADATRDALTGLVNRRHFDARLAALWGASGQAERPLTVMLIDVDHFKAFNDSYGHLAGDAALRAVAQALRAAARGPDVVARFGGEEMALLATGLTEQDAETLAGKLRAAVEALAIPHSGSTNRGVVTVSIGAACLVPLPGRSSTGALQLADENLYAAKRQGRNRVVFRADQYPMMRTGAFRRPEA
ncbi:MAG: diguanylate cyclase domain-containing protein [Steroidobacteraceae bacterium]